MSNMLQTGAAWLAGQLQNAAGRTVTLLRRESGGTTESGPLVGTVAKQEYQVVEQGMPTIVTSYDWTFTTSELPWTLRAGDVIKETLNSVEQQYQVMPLDKLPATERLDTAGVMTLVHSKKIQ
jgi:hypothetical protein